jgi:hypothetical protein
MLLLFLIGFLEFWNIQILVTYVLLHPVFDEDLIETTATMFPGSLDLLNDFSITDRQRAVLQLTLGIQLINFVLFSLLLVHWVHVLQAGIGLLLVYFHLSLGALDNII